MKLKVKLFTLNIYIMKKKIMVQRTHREVWLKNEFNLLKKLVDDCVQGKNMAESYFLMTGVKIPVDNNDDLIPSDDEEDPDHPVDLLEVRPESLPLPSDTDEDEDDIVLKIPNSRRKFKTPTGRRKKTPGKPKLDNRKKPGNSNKNPDNHGDVELRLRNLEEETRQIDSTLASQIS